MGRVLVDDDDGGSRLRNDIGFVELRARRPERPIEEIGRGRLGAGTQVHGGLGKRLERGLHRLGETGRHLRARLPPDGVRRPCCAPGQRLERRRAALCAREMPGRLERVAHGADEKGAHAGPVAEAHLGFRGVDVDVDVGGRHVDEEREQRIAALRHEVAVGRAHGAGDELVLDRAPVDEEVELSGIWAVERRQAGKAGHRHAVALGPDGESVGHELAAHDAAQPLEQPLGRGVGRRQHEARALPGRERKADFGVRHGQALHDLGGRLVLGALRLQKLQARGRRREEVAHLDARAGVEAGGLQGVLRAAIDDDLEAVTSASRARPDAETRDRADGGQCLAAEAKRRNRREIVV